MSQGSEVEFVCYAEGGFIDLEYVLDDLLAPTLDQLLSAPPPAPEPKSDQFRPSLRPLMHYRAAEDISRPILFQESEPWIYEFDRRDPLLVRSSTPERVFPFEKKIEPPTLSLDEVLTPIVEQFEPFPVVEPPQRIFDIPQREIETFQRTSGLLMSRREPAEPAPKKINKPLALASAPGSLRTYHDLLIARSLVTDEGRASKPEMKLPNLPRLALRIFTEITLFAGGGAIGAGFLVLLRDLSLNTGAGVIFASGVVSIAVSVLIRVAPKGKALATTARA